VQYRNCHRSAQDKLV